MRLLDEARALRPSVLEKLGLEKTAPLPAIPTGLGQEEDFAQWQSESLAEAASDSQALQARVALHLKAGEALLAALPAETVLARDAKAKREAARARNLVWQLYQGSYFALWMRGRSPQLAADVYRAFIWPEIPAMAREPVLVGAPGEAADLPQLLQDGAVLFAVAKRPEDRFQCLSFLALMGASLGRADKGDWAKFQLAEILLARGDKAGALALLRELKSSNVAGLAKWGAQLEKNDAQQAKKQREAANDAADAGENQNP